MRWRVRKILAGVSLLVCVAVAGVWVRSYWGTDVVRVWERGMLVAVGSARGDLWVEVCNWPGQRAFTIATFPLDAQPRAHREWMDRNAGVSFLGVVVASNRQAAPGVWGLPRDVLVRHWVVVPWWLVGLGPLLVLAVLGGRRVRGRVKGLCAGCGYDLRGSVGRCPECGLELARRKTVG